MVRTSRCAEYASAAPADDDDEETIDAASMQMTFHGDTTRTLQYGNAHAHKVNRNFCSKRVEEQEDVGMEFRIAPGYNRFANKQSETEHADFPVVRLRSFSHRVICKCESSFSMLI